MLYTKVLDEYKIDYEEYLREREVDFFGMIPKVYTDQRNRPFHF